MQAHPILSKMSVFGHPIHPMLIHFPVAFLLGLVVTDIAYIWTGDFFWARAGLWLCGIGTLGGWVAGLAGSYDLIAVRLIRHLINGWCHALLAVMMLSLATFNWMMRLDDAAAMIMPWGLYMSCLTGFLIAVTSSLGGRLVYEHAVGIHTE